MKQPINIENRKLNKKIIEDFLIKEGFKKVTGIGEKYKHKKYKNLSVFLDFVLVQLFIAIFVYFYSDQLHLISHVKLFDYVIGFFTGIGIASTYDFLSGLIRKK